MDIIHADFLELKLPQDSMDLIITSPPYNLGIDYGVYKDNLNYKDYLEFSQKWLAKCYELLKSGGRLCINVPIDTGKQDRKSLSADLTILAKRAGFKYKGTIIWNKQNSSNKYSIAFSKNLEVIIILCKDEWKPVKIEFGEWVNNIWTFSGENTKNFNHSAPFPVEIPRRLIKMFSVEGDIVLDPFMGSGTTVVACKMLKRNGIGVEINGEYCEVAKKRLDEVVK